MEYDQRQPKEAGSPRRDAFGELPKQQGLYHPDFEHDACGVGFVADAGAKILAKDVAPYLAGHGSVVGYPEAVISRVNDHHGVVDLPAGADRPAIGQIVWIAPNHVCPVVNLVDTYVIAQGGRVVDTWPVDARGRNA